MISLLSELLSHPIPQLQVILSPHKAGGIVYYDECFCHVIESSCGVERRAWYLLDRNFGNGRHRIIYILAIFF